MPLDYYVNKDDIVQSKGQTVAQYYTPSHLDDLDATYGYMQNPLFGKSDYDRVEMHVYDLDNKHLFSTHEAEDWTLNQPKGDGSPNVSLSFYKNLTEAGFTNGTFTTVYNFHRDAIGKPTGPKFKVHAVSKDRTEIRLIPTDIILEGEDSTPEADEFYSRYDKLKRTSAVQGPYKFAAIPNNPLWTQIQVNFGFNNVFTATSWLIDDIFPPDPDIPNTVLLKLLNPLPKDINLKQKCWLVAEATQPIINKVLIDVPVLRGANSLANPNFDLCLDTTARVQTGYRSYDDILGGDTDTRSEILNSYSSSADGIRLNIDYSCFENYIHFSSANSRVENFIYKLKQISGYDKKAREFDYSDNAAQDIYIYEYTGSLGTKYVKQYQKRWIDKKVKLINDFDDFEKWLYFESGSKARFIHKTGSRGGDIHDWSRSVITPFPKLSGSYKNDLWTEDYYDWSLDQLFDWAVHAVFTPGPNYELLNVTHSKSVDWKTAALASASAYDKQNNNLLSKTAPQFIGDIGKDSNATYLNFLDLTGQAHDIWWTYTKHITDISNRQHNKNFEYRTGVSDDMIYHIGKASGINLIEGDPNQELWKYKLGKTAEGSRHQNNPTASIMTMTDTQRTAETWKRIVNNLPLLLKSKGTTIGTRGLINCYGIPEHILPIYEYGSSKKSEQSTLFEHANFSYCLNFNQSQSVSTYWGPHNKTAGKVTSSAITPNAVQFRAWPSPNAFEFSQSLWQVNNDIGVVLHRSRSSKIKPNGQDEGYTDYGHFSLVFSSSIDQGSTNRGYYSASTQKAKIFESQNTREQGDGWWTVTVNRRATSGNPVRSGTYHSSSKFTYELVAMRSEYGVIDQAVSTSFAVTGGGTHWSSSFNDAWSGSLQSNKKSYFGGYIDTPAVGVGYITHSNHSTFGTPFSGSMQELRYFARPLSQSTMEDHTLSPEMYSSNLGISTYDDLLARYKLDERANHFSASKYKPNASSSVWIESLQPDQRTGSRNWNTTTFVLKAEANNFPFKLASGYTEEKFYTNTPEAGPNSYTSNKVRYEENKLVRHLSPTARAEKPTTDKYALDSNKLGIYFSPTDQINKDIFDHIGGLPLDNYLGNPLEQFDDSYSELKNLNRNYWKKYNNTQNKQAYLDRLKLYDMSLFTMLKRMLPARANADLGVVIEPHFIERAKLPSRGKITITGDTKKQNIAVTPKALVKFKNPTTITNNKPQVKEIGFAIQPQTITAKIGKPSKPPTKIGTAPVVKKGTTKTNISTDIVTPVNSILRSFSATPQQTSLVGKSAFTENTSIENSTTINGVIGSNDAPIMILSNQTARDVGVGIDKITQYNGSNVVSHTGVTEGSYQQQMCGNIKVRSLRNQNGVTATPYTFKNIIPSKSFKNSKPVITYITASTPTYKAEATSSHICEYRRSEIYKVASYFYTTAASASRGKGYETGGSVNKWAYSQSLKWAEVQDFNIVGSERVARLRYKGSQLNGPDFNIDSSATPDNGPVVSFTIGDPNNLISSDAGFGGNLSIE